MCADTSHKYGSFKSVIHLFASGMGATVGLCVTSPLDVVQTRLQSTHLNFSNVSKMNAVLGSNSLLPIHRPYFQILFAYMRHMIQTEGIASMFKGLSPSLIGIVPAKSLYFLCYVTAKKKLNEKPLFLNHQHVIHTLSAVVAGSFTSTVTNPIWYIKTKLQLRRDSKQIGAIQVIREGYKKHGFKCFFRGLSASYVGVLETVIYFILYEHLKNVFNLNNKRQIGEKFQALNFIFAATSSKIAATTLVYPHEVIRTRLRQDVKDKSGQLKYRNFIQSLNTVRIEEGRSGLYGGFGTSLMRQLPYTAVMFLTYEAILHSIESE